MSHALDGPRLKLGRANVHLESLKQEVQGFLDGNPYGAVAEHNRQTGKCILRAKVHSDPHVEWSTLIGDIAHNLRSALDQVAWQLALLQNPTPFHRTGFPIFTAFNKYRDNGLPTIPDLTARQKTLIRRLQPYHRGVDAESHSLWLLYDVNNTDKHRVIQTVGAVLGFNGLGINELWGFDLSNVNVYGGRTVEDGTPIADFTLVQTPPNARMQMNPDFTYDIQFGEGSDAAQGMSLLPTLSDILAHVERVVPMFERFL